MSCKVQCEVLGCRADLFGNWMVGGRGDIEIELDGWGLGRWWCWGDAGLLLGQGWEGRHLGVVEVGVHICTLMPAV